MGFPWSEDLPARRLINLIYNYEYINSSSKLTDKKKLDKVFLHIQRVLFEFNFKQISEVSSYDILANLLSSLIINKLNNRKLDYIKFIVNYQIDKIGMHKSYNVLEHSKFINNLNELKNILLFDFKESNIFDELILKMTSILNQYFHNDGSLPLLMDQITFIQKLFISH